MDEDCLLAFIAQGGWKPPESIDGAQGGEAPVRKEEKSKPAISLGVETVADKPGTSD